MSPSLCTQACELKTNLLACVASSTRSQALWCAATQGTWLIVVRLLDSPSPPRHNVVLSFFCAMFFIYCQPACSRIVFRVGTIGIFNKITYRDCRRSYIQATWNHCPTHNCWSLLYFSDDDFDMSRYSSSGYSSAEVRCLRDQVFMHTYIVSQHHLVALQTALPDHPVPLLPSTSGICAAIKTPFSPP